MKPIIAAAAVAGVLSIGAFIAVPTTAWAADGGVALDLFADAAAGDAEPDAAQAVWSSCTERIPTQATRPKMTESFPSRALAGYAIGLRVQIEHGKGETVLPGGLQLQLSSDAARAIQEAGFVIPSADGGAGPTMNTVDRGSGALTEVVMSLVALPEKPGRHILTLPPLPIAVARASGELVTLCTSAHKITIDDPTANTPDAMPKPNPQARPQREEWTAARDITIAVLAGAAVAALLTWLILRWLRRPRPVPPPPPPRPPWEVAFEEFVAIRSSGLVVSGHLAEHFDRVSDAVRRYLGGRYGFDGIESTTDEVLQIIKQVSLPPSAGQLIRNLLMDCDLVKFARLAPAADDCWAVLLSAEQLVHATMPGALPASRVAPHEGGSK